MFQECGGLSGDSRGVKGTREHKDLIDLSSRWAWSRLFMLNGMAISILPSRRQFLKVCRLVLDLHRYPQLRAYDHFRRWRQAYQLASPSGVVLQRYIYSFALYSPFLERTPL